MEAVDVTSKHHTVRSPVTPPTAQQASSADVTLPPHGTMDVPSSTKGVSNDTFLAWIKEGDGLIDEYKDEMEKLDREGRRADDDSDRAAKWKSQAYAAYTKIVTEARSSGNKTWAIRGLCRLGECYFEFDEDKSAKLDLLIQAFELSRSLKDPAMIGLIAQSIGDILLDLNLGYDAEAETYYEMAANNLEGLDEHALSRADLYRGGLRALGQTDIERFDRFVGRGKYFRTARQYDKSIVCLSSAASICETFLRTVDDDPDVREQLFEALNEQGKTYYAQRELLEAESMFERVVKEGLEREAIDAVATARLGLGDVARQTDRLADADDYYRSIVREEEVDPLVKEAALNRLIAMGSRQANYEEMIARYREILELCDDFVTPDLFGSAILHLALGDLQGQRGERRKAVSSYERCIGTIPDATDRSHEVYVRSALIGLTKCYLALKEYDKADASLSKAFSISMEEDCADWATLQLLAGQIYLDRGQPTDRPRAFHHFSLARQHAKLRKDNEVWMRACEGLARQPQRERTGLQIWEREVEEARNALNSETNLDGLFNRDYPDPSAFFASPLLDNEEYSLYDFLHEAIKRDRSLLVREMFYRWNLNSMRRNESGQNCLHLAARYGSVDTIKHLRSISKELLHQEDKEGRTPIQVAAEYGQVRALRYFCEQLVISAAIIDGRERSLLHHAAYGNQPEACRYLLDALEKEKELEVVDRWDVDGKAAIHIAAEKNALEVMKIFERADMDLEALDTQGNTPLHYAARANSVGVFKFLVNECKVSCSITNYAGHTPAAVTSHSGIRELLNAEVQKKTSDRSGTPTTRYLIFKGGGMKGAAYGSAVKAAIKHKLFLLDDIDGVGGASAGAITALVIALNFGVADIDRLLRQDFSRFLDSEEPRIKEIFLEKRYEKWTASLSTAQDVKLLLECLYKNKGLFKGEALLGWFQDLIESKGLPREATFRDLHDRGFKDLQLVSVNTWTREAETLSYEHTPSYCVADAVRASMAIPAFFYPWHQHHIVDGKRQPVSHCLYMDGGTFENLPIQLFDKKKYVHGSRSRHSDQRIVNPEVLAFSLEGLEKPPTLPDSEPSFFQYLFSMAMTMTSMKKQTSDFKRSGDSARTITIFNAGVGTVEFGIGEEAMKNLKSQGKLAVIRYAKSQPKPKPPVTLSPQVLAILAQGGELSVERGQIRVENLRVTKNRGQLVYTAAREGNIALLDALRVPLNATDSETGYNAFHWLAHNNLSNPQVIRELLRGKCDIDAEDMTPEKHTPLDLALKKKTDLAVWALREYGASRCKDPKAVEEAYVRGKQQILNLPQGSHRELLLDVNPERRPARTDRAAPALETALSVAYASQPNSNSNNS